MSSLGSSFEMFSTTQRLLSYQQRGISFHDLVFKAEIHELFLAILTPTNPYHVTFNATSSVRGYSTNTHGSGSSRGGSSSGHGLGEFLADSLIVNYAERMVIMPIRA